MDFQITRILHKALRQAPERRYLHDRGQDFSYAQFTDRVARLAGVLQDLGLQADARVGMLALNSHRFIEYFFATWWAGGVINPVNIRWSPREIAYSLDDCDTRILLVDDAFVPLVAEIRQLSSALTTVVYTGHGQAPEGMLHYEQLLAAAQPVADANRQGEQLAAIMYTGGTTGQPKGVMLSQRNIMAGTLGTLIAVPRPLDSIALIAAPIFHIGGMGAVIHITHCLQEMVLLPIFNELDVLKAIQTHGIKDMFLVPTMLKRVLDHPHFADYDMASLRLMLYGAAPIEESLLNQAIAAFPNAEFVQVYGMTECSPVNTALPHRDHLERHGQPPRLRSAGLPLMTTEIRIVDADGQEVPAGQVGELVARGPTVMLGYWNKPEQTAQALRNGWMHTGDGAYRDAEGYLYVVDRVKDMIITGGENVYSAEVENAIAELPEVLMSAVIGIPHEQFGEQVHAVVVLRPEATLTEQELIAHCKQLIASYKCPRSVEFRAELPLSAAGKLQKFQLREPFWQARSRRIG